MLCSYSQNTGTTKTQQKLINKFTPEQYIDWSKGLDNEKNQSIAIDSLQNIIDAKDILIEKLKEEHKKTLLDIITQNNISKETSKKIDSVTTDILKLNIKPTSKFDWGSINLYGGFEIPELKFEDLIVNSELMYEIKNVEFGIKGTAELKIINNEKKYFFNYLLKLRYKLF